MLLSILIPTLESRRLLFEPLYAGLSEQIHECGARDDVEVLWLRDAGQMLIGTKRNALLRQARGDFVVFVDDDDALSPAYVSRITDAIRMYPEVDCLGIHAEITFRGCHPQPMLYSAHISEARTVDGVYLRPAQHLNPIRREIALRYLFAAVRYSEDFDFGRRLQRAGALRREHMLADTLYHYRSRRSWTYQRVLDATEPLRHTLGLRRLNFLWSLRRKGPTPCHLEEL